MPPKNFKTSVSPEYLKNLFRQLRYYGFMFKSNKQKYILSYFLKYHDDLMGNDQTVEEIHNQLALLTGLTSGTVKIYFSDIFKKIKTVRNNLGVQSIYTNLQLENLKEEIDNIFDDQDDDQDIDGSLSLT